VHPHLRHTSPLTRAAGCTRISRGTTQGRPPIPDVTREEHWTRWSPRSSAASASLTS
jgi:hypothetical protein